MPVQAITRSAYFVFDFLLHVGLRIESFGIKTFCCSEKG